MHHRSKVNRRLVVVPADAPGPRAMVHYPELGLAVEHRRVDDLDGAHRPGLAGRRSGMRILLALPLLLALGAPAPRHRAPVAGPGRCSLVRAYPHDPRAFTQGLFYRDGRLFESTGLVGARRSARSASRTARCCAASPLPPRLFGEGIVDWTAPDHQHHLAERDRLPLGPGQLPPARRRSVTAARAGA